MTSSTKPQWRSRLRSARLQMDDGDRRRAADGLASAGLGWVAQLRGGPTAGTVCAYVSSGSEPGTGLLLEALCAAGHLVFVPVCEAGYQLSWTRWTPGVQKVRSARAPVLEPSGPRVPFACLGEVDGILLPALAVDTTGVRLGQGGGYYDRFLASLASPAGGGVPATPTAGVVHEQEVFPPGVLPHDVLDRPVDWVVTPGGWGRAGSAGP